jgi:hypothetical protein
MPLTPSEVRDRLIAIVPEFEGQWESDENVFRKDDGSYTFSGVFAEFSHFVRDHFDQLSKAQLHEIGTFISKCIVMPDAIARDAAATCFLENLCFERFSAQFESYLSDGALRVYRQLQGR